MNGQNFKQFLYKKPCIMIMMALGILLASPSAKIVETLLDFKNAATVLVQRGLR